MAVKNIFGEFIKEKRLLLNVSLRQFCLENGFDPGNISKLERCLLKPPGDKELEKYALALKIKKSSDEWKACYDYASVGRGAIPAELLADRQVVEQLPLFFRTLRGEKVPREKMRDLVKLIKGS
jgi:transcriptional regulator with XRE-family HTH domain